MHAYAKARVVAFAVALAALAPAAHAIYMPPDIVDIPTDRLIKNLEATLASAPDGERVGVLMQIARVHAAAYADKKQTTSIVNPIHASSRPPTIKGPHTDSDVRGSLGYMYGRGGNLLEVLRRPTPYDPAAKCDPQAVGKLMELDGEIEVSFRISAGKGDARVAAKNLRLVRSTVQSKVVAPCLMAKLAHEVTFPTKDHASDVSLTFTFETQIGREQVFYGFGQVTVPNGVATALTPEDAAAAAAHLDQARQRYYEAVQAAPDDALAHLGLAWTLEQAGKVEEAKTCYRKTFDMAWAKEKELHSLGLGQRPIAAEAASYLIPLLDKDKDQAELDKLNGAVKHLVSMPRPVTPIVVPLTAGDELTRFVDASAGVSFDLDGSGARRGWGWIRSDAAWLVWDPRATGAVTSALQMFGSVSFWAFWSDGYAALAALDDDRDGMLTGVELAGLALWNDRDGDGVSDAGEVRPLGDWGIVGLATRALDVGGVLTAPEGVIYADGATRPSWDWTPTGSAIE